MLIAYYQPLKTNYQNENFIKQLKHYLPNFIS